MMRRIFEGKITGNDLFCVEGLRGCVGYNPCQWSDFVRGKLFTSCASLDWEPPEEEEDDFSYYSHQLNPWYANKGKSWQEYYDAFDKECGSKYHMVFVVFPNIDDCDGFICFRAKNESDLNAVMRACEREMERGT